MALEKTDIVSLTTLLLHKIPEVPTRKVLVLMDLRRDSSTPESIGASFIDRIRRLANEFRPSGDLIWIHTELENSMQSGYHGEGGYNIGSDLTHCSLPATENIADEDHPLRLAWSQSPPNENTLVVMEPIRSRTGPTHACQLRIQRPGPISVFNKQACQTTKPVKIHMVYLQPLIIHTKLQI